MNRYLQARYRFPTRKTYSESTVKTRTGCGVLSKQEKRNQSNLNPVIVLGFEEILNHSVFENVKIIIAYKTY